MKHLVRNLSLISSLLWAVAIVAAAILKAPAFLTLLLLPLLGFAALGTIQTMGRVATPRT